VAARNNAIAEITRFWLQSRYGCVVDEAIPVKVPFGNSDIDLVAIRPDLSSWSLPDGVPVTRLIVETKDEHDYDPNGSEVAKRLREDVALLGDSMYTPARQKVYFSMLRQEHFEVATRLFKTSDFDRLFVTHALNPMVRAELCPSLASAQRVHWMTIREVVADLREWYRLHPNPSVLRHTLVGDLWHLLVGYCGL
jgi:hypothetical protein